MADRRRNERLRRIAELIRSDLISSQQALAERLEGEGFAATQSAISRDLRELRVAKVAGRYALADVDSGVDAGELGEAAWLLRGTATAGPNLLVLHTAVGAASRVALELDRARWPECVGTIAGDDTVFVATPDSRRQEKLRRRLRKAMRESNHDG